MRLLDITTGTGMLRNRDKLSCLKPSGGVGGLTFSSDFEFAYLERFENFSDSSRFERFEQFACFWLVLSDSSDSRNVAIRE